MDINIYRNHVEKNEAWTELAARAYEAKKLSRFCAAEEKKLMQALKTLSGESNCHGGEYVLERSIRSGAIDYELIPAIQVMQPTEKDRYRKPDVCMWKLNKK